MQNSNAVAIVIAGALISGAILVEPHFSPQGRRIANLRDACEKQFQESSQYHVQTVEACISKSLNFGNAYPN